jgi:hypothetical protein
MKRARMTSATGLKGSIAFARLRGEIFFELAGFPVMLFCAVGRIPFDGDVWPDLGIVGIKLQPGFKTRLGVGLDRFSRAFRLTDATVDTFVRMNDEHILAFVEAVHWTHFHAVHVFALDAVFDDDISHGSGSFRRETEHFD